MSCQNYRILEMQNNNIGAVAVDGLMPFGIITRRTSCSTGHGVPFDVTTAGANTIVLTSKGYYKVMYNSSLTVGAAGAVTLTLLVDGAPVYSVTENAAGAGAVNLTLIKEVRVFANCASAPTNCPANIQIQLTGTDVTGGTSNIIVDSCING